MTTALRLSSVPVGTLRLDAFDGVLDPSAAEAVHRAERLAQRELAGRRIWNVNSTPHGGGVAELLTSLLAYARGSGVDARWLVIAADAPFFRLTKRVHNRLHGVAGDGGPLGAEERTLYEAALLPNAAALCELLRPGDAVILHDPQTAGLIPRVRACGVPVIWRCHVGLDTPNEHARDAWRFLEPYVRQADAYVFSREAFVWDELDPLRRAIIAPSIDAFSAKNHPLEPPAAAAILAAAGLSGGAAGEAVFHRADGRRARIRRRARLVEQRPLTPDDRRVVQVSRWDALKDPAGVIEGFARHVAPFTDAHLIYAGPDVLAVSDDPEGRRCSPRRASNGPCCRRRCASACTSRCCRWTTARRTP
jgi:trehalose synthase